MGILNMLREIKRNREYRKEKELINEQVQYVMNNINATRLKKKLSPRQLSNECGIPVKRMKIILSNNDYPNLEEVVRMTRALNLDININ